MSRHEPDMQIKIDTYIYLNLRIFPSIFLYIKKNWIGFYQKLKKFHLFEFSWKKLMIMVVLHGLHCTVAMQLFVEETNLKLYSWFFFFF